MKISIVMPAFNAQEFLDETLRSVFAQTRLPDEIVLVDNNSTDRTADIAASFGERVQVLHEPVPGAAIARLTGRAAATGDALMFLDADDLLGPTVLEELEAVLHCHPGAIAACPWQRYEQIDGEWQVRPASCYPRRAGQSALSAWLTGWYHPPCAVLWSATAYERSGGWDPTSYTNDDGDLVMRALVEGVPFIRTAGGMAYYRRLPEGQVSLSARRFTQKAIDNRLAVVERIERRLKERDNIDDFRMALNRAYSLIAQDAVDFPELNERARNGMRRVDPTWTQRIGQLLDRGANRMLHRQDVPEMPAKTGAQSVRA